MINEERAQEEERIVTKILCQQSHLFFSRYFFKARQDIKFKVNWHHHIISDHLQQVTEGKIKNLCINVPPGSSKTELAVINFIARGMALNPRARFLHLSGSDTLASLNSSTARDLILSDEYQKLWPIKIAEDAKSKKRWNVLIGDQLGGGVYATSLGGQITGFRAGHMAPGFYGALIIDDPIKPEDAFSKSKLDAANRKLITTIKSRKANPDTPIVIIMQRIAESDPVGFIKAGALGEDWTFLVIPAVINEEYVQKLAPKYQKMIDLSQRDDHGRLSYWPYKEPLNQLLAMERGDGSDQSGAKISRHVFSSQYQQDPVALGGNIIRGDWLIKYSVLPKIKYRKIFADTAQKTAERNDYSVFSEWGLGYDNKAYLIHLLRGKWEAPELQRRAVGLWAMAKSRDVDQYGQLREMIVEDASSGSSLIQQIRYENTIPIKPIIRVKDKLTRAMNALPYIESGMVCIPIDAPFTNDFVQECESFTADNSHSHDDQIDTLTDCVEDMLSTSNKLKLWAKLGE